MSDEGFHEIQLNGKQLVFLFMAATVVSVVIFLCGVMVGRGVQTARGAADDAVQESAGESVRPVDPAASTSGDAEPSSAEPPPVENDYYDRLVGGKTGESLEPRDRAGRESPRAAAEPPAREEPRRETVPEKSAPAATAAKPAAEKPTATTAARPERSPDRSAARTDTDPTPSGRYAVQLAALRERNEAEAIVKRLVAKGYQAYVLVPSPGAPPVYRVQVGRFTSRGEADRTAARLRKEEQFTPWVTR